MVQLGGATVVAMMRLLRKGRAQNVMRSQGEFLPVFEIGFLILAIGAGLASLGVAGMLERAEATTI
jgi:hypothetical protein